MERTKNVERDIKCPQCTNLMTFQGVESVGAGAARIRNVDVYLWAGGAIFRDVRQITIGARGGGVGYI